MIQLTKGVFSEKEVTMLAVFGTGDIRSSSCFVFVDDMPSPSLLLQTCEPGEIGRKGDPNVEITPQLAFVFTKEQSLDVFIKNLTSLKELFKTAIECQQEK